MNVRQYEFLTCLHGLLQTTVATRDVREGRPVSMVCGGAAMGSGSSVTLKPLYRGVYLFKKLTEMRKESPCAVSSAPEKHMSVLSFLLRMEGP